MTKYVIRVDTSLYTSESNSAVGTSFQIINASCDTEEVIFEDTRGQTMQTNHSTEAELFGIETAIEIFNNKYVQDEDVIVLHVKCDCDSAVQLLQDKNPTFTYCDNILSRVDDFYSVKWEVVKRSSVHELDTKAKRVQRRVRDNHPEFD